MKEKCGNFITRLCLKIILKNSTSVHKPNYLSYYTFAVIHLCHYVFFSLLECVTYVNVLVFLI